MWVIALAALFALAIAIGANMINSSWYLGNNEGTVGIYQGLNSEIFGIPLNHLVETTSVEVADLPDATQSQLEQGIRTDDENSALDTINSYHEQIDTQRSQASSVASDVKSTTSKEELNNDLQNTEGTNNLDTSQQSSAATEQPEGRGE